MIFVSSGAGGAEMFRAITDNMEGVENIAITDIAKAKNPKAVQMNLSELYTYLEGKKTVVVGERSNSVHLQNALTRHCREQGIYNICHLDLYGGYEERFTEIPNMVVAPSDRVKEELIEFGLEKDNVVVGGNPAFERILGMNYTRVPDRVTPKVLYVSQGDVETLFDVCKAVDNNFDEYQLDIKLHPEEKTVRFKQTGRVNVLECCTEVDFLSRCLEYDLIIGKNSTLQLQSCGIGIPTVFGEHASFDEGIKDYKAGICWRHLHTGYEKDALERSIRIYEEFK